MATVQITGWRRDANKVGADKIVTSLSSLGLAESKRAIDTVMEGGSVTIPVPSDDLAIQLSKALRNMNFDARPC